MGVNLNGPNAGIETGVSRDKNKELVCLNQTYSIPPGRIGTAGLNNINFREIKYISIFSATTGEFLLQNGHACQEELLIHIKRDDLTVVNLSPGLAEKIR